MLVHFFFQQIPHLVKAVAAPHVLLDRVHGQAVDIVQLAHHPLAGRNQGAGHLPLISQHGQKNRPVGVQPLVPPVVALPFLKP